MNNFNIDYYMQLTECWDYLSNTDLPIFIYGMGDGALKILKQFKENNIACSGFFASDEFVRGHSFQGHLVHKLSEVENNVKEFIVVMAFAAGYDSLIDKIIDISSRHMLFAPDIPVFGDNIFNKQFLKENFDKLGTVYNMLCDDKSKEVYRNIIEFKITGKIEPLIKIWSDRSESYKDILKLTHNEIYVDAGAYKGDTIDEFLSYTDNSYEYIYGLEPDTRNFKKLILSTENKDNVENFNCAVWHEDKMLTFSNTSGRQSAVSKQGKEVSGRSIDSILNGKKATFIKYDVEGAEKEALEGTRNTIKNFSPKLKVAIYHRSEDLFSIPLQIKELNPEYKFYIRMDKYIPAWEINLFAV